MAIYECHNDRFVAVDWTARARGLDAYLCAPGPSLAAVDAAALAGPGRVVVGVNTAYPTIRPDVWVGMDGPECYDRALWAEPFAKVIGSRYARVRFGGRELAAHPAVAVAAGRPGRPYEMLDRLGPDAPLLWNGNTFLLALHLCVLMGARRVVLVGCDFGGAGDYCDGRPLSAAHRRRNRKLYAQLVAELPILALMARRAKIELGSATPGSPANRPLPYRPLAEWQADSAAKALPAAPLLDAADAERCRWAPAVSDGLAVATVADARTEWRLDAWYRQLAPLLGPADVAVFGDAGLSEPRRRWCRARGVCVDLRDLPGRLGSLAASAPFALLAAPAGRAAFFDAAHAPSAEELAAAGEGGLAAAPDGRWMACPHGEEHISDRARRLLADATPSSSKNLPQSAVATSPPSSEPQSAVATLPPPNLPQSAVATPPPSGEVPPQAVVGASVRLPGPLRPSQKPPQTPAPPRPGRREPERQPAHMNP